MRFFVDNLYIIWYEHFDPRFRKFWTCAEFLCFPKVTERFRANQILHQYTFIQTDLVQIISGVSDVLPCTGRLACTHTSDRQTKSCCHHLDYCCRCNYYLYYCCHQIDLQMLADYRHHYLGYCSSCCSNHCNSLNNNHWEHLIAA